MAYEHKRNRLVRKVGDYRATYYEKTKPPRIVSPVSRLKGDATVLKELTTLVDPPLRKVMCIKLGSVFLGGGDALGRGFG